MSIFIGDAKLLNLVKSRETVWKTEGLCDEMEKLPTSTAGVKESLWAQLALPHYTCSQCQAWKWEERRGPGSVQSRLVKRQDLAASLLERKGH